MANNHGVRSKTTIAIIESFTYSAAHAQHTVRVPLTCRLCAQLYCNFGVVSMRRLGRVWPVPPGVGKLDLCRR